jgi:hypothetical protein
MRVNVTTHVQLGRKSLGCPAELFAAVGTIGEASDLGCLNINEIAAASKHGPWKIVFADRSGKC